MLRSVFFAGVLVSTTLFAVPPVGGQMSSSADDVCRDFEAGRAAAVAAAREIVDTSQMWDWASCTSFVVGNPTPRREWVFSVTVLPHVLPTGVGVCSGLWAAPESDGLSVTCDRPDAAPPNELAFRTVRVPRGVAEDRFVVATGPAEITRLKVNTKAGTFSFTGRRPSSSWPVHYFAGRIPDPAAIRSIQAIDTHGDVIGRARGIEHVAADDFPSFRADVPADLVGSPNVILLFERKDAFTRMTLDG